MQPAAYHLDTLNTLGGIVARPQEAPEPGTHDVIVRLRAASLNRRDLMLLDGTYPLPATPGVIPLADGAGEVIAVGSDVRRAKVGDRVSATYFLHWASGPLTRDLARHQHGANHDGMLASYARLGEESVVQIPSHLSFEEAATLTCAGVTAWSALHGPRPVTAGQTVLTVGTGTVALFAIQLAHDLGARVISVTSGAAKAARLRELGAHVVVDRRAAPDWDAEVLGVTGGLGVDHVVEAVGPATLGRSLRCTGFDAHVALVGAFPAGGATLGDDVFAGRLYTIRRIAVGSRADFEALAGSLEKHGTRPVIDRVFPFGQAVDAYRYFGEGSPFGKVVITIP